MVRSPPVMSPSTATQMDSKMPNQGKPGSAGSQSQPSPCDPKTLSAKGAQNVAGGMGLKNGQGLSSGPSSKVKVKRERSTSVESFEQPESGTPTGDDKGKLLGASFRYQNIGLEAQIYRKNMLDLFFFSICLKMFYTPCLCTGD